MPVSSRAASRSPSPGDDLSPETPDASGPEAELRAARQGSVLADRSDLGRVLFSGGDAADLLHRLTTAAVRGLQPGQGTAAVFTTNKGRILDLVTLHRLPEGILALTAPGRAASIIAWVGRYTFREEVKTEDRTGSHATLALYGAGASRTIARMFGDQMAVLPRHHAATVECGGTPAVLLRAWPLGGEGWHLVLPVGALEPARVALRAADPGLVEAGPATLEVLRIEAGLPAPGSELTEDHNPWEARLDDAVALDKGCYVGQEVIARLHTYRKVARLLVRLEMDGTNAPTPGAGIARAGERIGAITSAARVPGQDRVVALGYVRDEDAASSEAVMVECSEGPVPGRILGLAR